MDNSFILVPRYEELLNLLKQNTRISNNELALNLGVSVQTIRRDIKKLEEAGFLNRFHGGVQSVLETNKKVNTLFSIRETTLVEEKSVIAKEVAKLIPDGSSIFITIGTTVEKIAEELLLKKDLFVFTNSLRVASILYKNKSINVCIPSGKISNPNGGIECYKIQSDLAEYKMDFMITSIGGIDQDGTLLDYNQTEVIVAKLMMNNVKKIILAADHTKLEQSAPLRLGSILDVDYYVTDKITHTQFFNYLKENHINVVVPNSE